MDRIIERPGALDVHKESVTACVRVWEGRGLEEHMAEFRTDGARAARIARLAGGARCQTGRDGVHQRVLEARVGDPRGQLRADARQRSCGEGGGVGLALRLLSDVVLEQSSLVGFDLDS